MSTNDVTAVQIKDLIDQIQITANALYEFSCIYPVNSEPYNMIYVIADRLRGEIDRLYIDFICLHGDQIVNC